METDLKARAARIESLKHTPAWDELASVLGEQEEKFWARHRADVAAGKFPTDVELARSMGKLDGIRALLSAPEKAAAILLRETLKEESADE
jgi:hypothetical protein